MEQTNLLKELIHQIKDNKLLSDHGNVARTCGINGGNNNKAGANNEVTRPVPLEGTTKEEIMRMVEATAMVYKVMEEQHKMDSFVPKEPAILKDEIGLNEFALQLCRTYGKMHKPSPASYHHRCMSIWGHCPLPLGLVHEDVVPQLPLLRHSV
jgi:hypothetical protein